MSDSVDVAVVGLGMMGSNHVRVYRGLPEARLVGLVDTDPCRRDNAATLTPGVPVFNDVRRMLLEAKPAAVSIVAPTREHLALALLALDAGAHVLVEKPIAADLVEGTMLIRSAAAAERMLMVGHVERFNPAVRELKRRLNAGELGRVYQVHAQRVGPFPARIRDVGVVHDLAPHDIDVMRYLLGEEVTRVYAETERRLSTEYEDMVMGLLRFESGVVGSLDINWLTPEKIRRLRVLGEGGTYELDYIAQTLFFAPRHDDGAVSERTRLWPSVEGAQEEPLRLELAAFLDAILRGSPSPMSGTDALAALDLASKLVESGLSGVPTAVAHPLLVETT